MSQFKKVEPDLRARGEIKWNHAMHIIRLLLQGTTALREGDLRLHLDEERDPLLTIKSGELLWLDVNAWRLLFRKKFDEAFASTCIQEGTPGLRVGQ